jgi:uncharacterized protein YeaO (DUF488 family)
MALILPQEACVMSDGIPADHIAVKRAYESASPEDGTRILVDRLWPRGVTKEKAALDVWVKDIAPSTELRKWFGHDPARWKEFRERYSLEVKEHAAELAHLRELARKGKITLVYAARDEEHNEALVLRDLLLGRKSG